ncbi:MAG TPA: NAD(P)/FAD-dependent oxidoreductase [Clostridiales bacterium]|nr:NAD(P)/FAD-dependent oxidoreductase [Clostridiales bacterium]
MLKYDVIIIGKGPAGLSAALYTARANLKTLILGKNDSALGKAAKIENYFGFSSPVSGKFLLDEGEKQALNVGADIVNNEVVSIEKSDAFEVTTSEEVYEGIAVLIATGQPQKKLKIKNMEKFEGNGVSYCTTCDGYFYNNLKVGVLGNKDYAVHEAMELEAYTKDITIYTNGKELDLTEKYSGEIAKYQINTKSITEINGADYLQRICFADETWEDLDGLFIANESASSIDFARKLGVITEGNSIVVDSEQRTNLEGLFAAGDCTGGFKQISTAVGQGALAGRKIIEYIR